jgi:GLPGLI family protein
LNKASFLIQFNFMNIKFIISLFILLQFSKTIGQEKAQIFATYSFINSNLSKNQTVKLRISNNESSSEFFDNDAVRDTLYTDEFENVTFKKVNQDSIKQQYYLTKDQIIFRDHVYTNNKFLPVIVTESMPKFNWIMLNGTKKIGNFICNKAGLNFRGRNYTIWYTTEIPTSFGPWKFYGLPGLITSITTDDKSIVFDLVSVESTSKVNISAPSEGEQIEFKEYVAYQEKVTSDFVEKLKSKLPRGATISVNKVEPDTIEKNYD